MAKTYSNTLNLTSSQNSAGGGRHDNTVKTSSVLFTPSYITPDDISNYANNARAEYEKSLGYLIDAVNDDYNYNTTLRNQQYNRLLDTLNNDYSTDTRNAYINKMLTDRDYSEGLTNAGVSTQGVATDMYVNNNIDWNNTLRELKDELNANKDDAKFDYDTDMNKLYRNYLSDLNSTQAKIQSLGDTYYKQILGDATTNADNYNAAQALQAAAQLQATRQNALEDAQANLKAGTKNVFSGIKDNFMSGYTDNPVMAALNAIFPAGNVIGATAGTIIGNLKGNSKVKQSNKQTLSQAQANYNSTQSDIENSLSELYAKGLIDDDNLEALLIQLGYEK